MAITHAKVSAVADSADVNLVRPSDWNASHVIRSDEVVATTNATLTATQCAGTVINNYGQANNLTLTLPTAVVGLGFTVIVGTSVAKYLRLDPSTNDKIYLDGTPGSDGKYVGLSSASVKIGSVISFKSFKTGSTTFDWFASAVTGSWTAET